MHLILINYDKNINNIEIKNQTDIMTVKFIKNFIIDVVRIKKHNVLQDYNNSVRTHKIKDNHIFNWIKNTLLMIKNIESNKQIISDNISRSSINKTYTNEEYDNENENENDNENENENDNNDINQFNKNEKKINLERKEEYTNSQNNLKSKSKMIKVNSKNINTTNKRNTISEKNINYKDDNINNIVDRIKLLKQNLKDNNNIYHTNNSTSIKRKKSIEINKKLRNKK
jgi:hypothetical protein